MLIMRAKRILKRTGRKLTINGNETIGFDKSNVECYNCHKRRHFARKYKALKNQDNKHKESSKRSVPMKTPAFTAFVSVDMIGVIRQRKDLIMHSWLSHLQLLTQRIKRLLSVVKVTATGYGFYCVLYLKKSKTTQAKEITNLKKKVKRLERKRRSRTPGMNLFKIGTSRRRSLDEDDASK
nr:hypothetical protein [Tanacetum cinerariifolium]